MVACEQLHVLTNSILEWLFATDPFDATALGEYKYDNLVPDLSRRAINGRVAQLHAFQQELEKIEVADSDIDAKVDHKLLHIVLNNQLRSLKVIRPYEKDPGTVPGMIMTMAYTMLAYNYAPIDERADRLMRRLKHTPTLLSQGRQLVEKPSKEFTEIAIMEVEAGGISFFLQLASMIEAQGGQITPKMHSIIETVVDALREHIAWMKQLLPTASGDYAVGEEVFNEMLREEHLLSDTTDTLIAKGWKVYNETVVKMQEISRQIDPSKTWEQIVEDMKNDHPSTDELLSFCRNELDKLKQFIVDRQIVDLPDDEKLKLEYTPVFIRNYIPFAAYFPPPTFGEPHGTLWITPADPQSPRDIQEQKLREHNIYSLPCGLLHEAYPGHHLQICWSQSATSLVRRISTSNLFMEGWAFYCEELLEQLGYLSVPQMKLARLCDQMWRAARVIIDASLHTHRMTFDEAVDFLVNRVHKERSNAWAEVSRYIRTPTQPMSYLIGKLELVEIAEEYRQLKGDAFELRSFHNKLLSFGSIPPALVRQVLFVSE